MHEKEENSGALSFNFENKEGDYLTNCLFNLQKLVKIDQKSSQEYTSIESVIQDLQFPENQNNSEIKNLKKSQKISNREQSALEALSARKFISYLGFELAEMFADNE